MNFKFKTMFYIFNFLIIHIAIYFNGIILKNSYGMSFEKTPNP
jgi:hypothetical protein